MRRAGSEEQSLEHTGEPALGGGRQAQLAAVELKKKLAETTAVALRYKQTANKLKDLTEQRTRQLALVQKQLAQLKEAAQLSESEQLRFRQRAEAADGDGS